MRDIQDSNNHDAIAKAKEILNQGGLVGLPTETVYGLAARIDIEEALHKIFSTKNRPFFDPLIVHVKDIEQAKSLVQSWPIAVDLIARNFWPGPLTLVLPKNEKVSNLITAGLQTVGLRCPRHPVALRLIELVGAPLAAPSANRFGKTSPTAAQHVYEEFGDEVFVLEGGDSEIGIESTILSIKEGNRLQMLRPGLITQKEIDEILKKNHISFEWVESDNPKSSPGMMKHHYMPNRPLVLVDREPDQKKLIAKIDQHLRLLPKEIEGVTLLRPKAVRHILRLELSEDPRMAARELYQKLRLGATSGADVLYLVWPKIKRIGEWTAIWDRLSKAASLDFVDDNDSSR